MAANFKFAPLRNIFLFIRQYSNAIFFLVLQAICIWTLFTYDRFHRAKGLGVANQVTGWVNTQYNKVEDFVNRAEESRRVHKLNDSLVNLLPENFSRKDTGSRLVRDSVLYDTSGQYRRYIYREAQVVYSSVSQEKNYIQINRGSRDGIKDDMGVLNSDLSLVGRVVNVSPDYSVIMSLLHVQNRTSVMVRKTRSSGIISWDGKDPRFLTLNNIPKSDSIVKGDTIITGNYSISIPPGKMVGTVAEIIPDNSTNFYILKVRTAARFQDLQQVFVVENLQYEEQAKSLEETRKKIEEPKAGGK